MIVAIHQPDYIPWMGFFSKVSRADLFVVGDTVQYRSDGFTNRNRIKTATGPKWLTVPIVHKSPQGISEVRISNELRNGISWQDLHLRTLEVNYSRAKFYGEYVEGFARVLRREWNLLADLNFELVKHVAGLLGIRTKMVRLSQLHSRGRSNQLIIDICREVGANGYVSGPMGRRYIKPELFKEAGIELAYDNYSQPTYEQQFQEEGFLPRMSVVDLVFNVGPGSGSVLRSGFRSVETA